jgi:MFS family permease
VLIEGLTRATKLQLDFGPAIGARLWMRAGLLGAGGSKRCFYFSLGIISGGAGAMSYTDVVSHWFDRHRGLAPSVMMLGMELGAIVIPSVAQRLIATLGWRLSYTVFGLAILFLPLPVVAAFLKERPENVGLDQTPAEGKGTYPGFGDVQPFRQLGWVYHFYFDLIHGCSAKRIELNALD